MEAKIHYHICWSDSSIDWKAFPTKQDASDVAGKIKKPNESYVDLIEFLELVLWDCILDIVASDG